MVCSTVSKSRRSSLSLSLSSLGGAAATFNRFTVATRCAACGDTFDNDNDDDDDDDVEETGRGTQPTLSSWLLCINDVYDGNDDDGDDEIADDGNPFIDVTGRTIS